MLSGLLRWRVYKHDGSFDESCWKGCARTYDNPTFSKAASSEEAEAALGIATTQRCYCPTQRRPQSRQSHHLQTSSHAKQAIHGLVPGRSEPSPFSGTPPLQRTKDGVPILGSRESPNACRQTGQTFGLQVPFRLVQVFKLSMIKSMQLLSPQLSSLRSRRNALELPSRGILPAIRGVSVIHPFHIITIFCLPTFTFSSESEATLTCEADYTLVMDACRVVTNGQGSDLHLVQERDDSRVPSGTTTLASGRYYCHLDVTSHETPVDYEVVTDFAAWTFPHSNLPPHWIQPLSLDRELQRQERFAHLRPSNMSGKVKNEDQHCVITKYSTSRSKPILAIQNAYIISKESTDWFAAHHMEYDRSQDREKFEIHVVVRGALDYAELLHLRLVMIPDRISVEYLYARFAYTIISRIPKGSAKESKRVKVHGDIQAARTARQIAAEESKNKKRKLDQISEPDNTEWDQPSGYSTDMPLRCAQDPDACAEGDKLWHDQFLEMHPDLAEELSDPPETSTKWHTDTLRMLRLKSEYMRQNPQVWQTSMTPPGSVREDVESYHADRLLSLTKRNRGA
ncbi:hypothetical protein K474DRAFT_1679718 [Panus rudis PR-1116 ss-1]|nr:hypothetical protein K474DRAFT_1679718 [Panus rudis PR-1116 ss-1]